MAKKNLKDYLKNAKNILKNTEMLKKIYLLRHCSTRDSELGINGSRTDTPLSEKGLKQADDLIPKLAENNYDLIFISPLKRTLQTIDPCLKILNHKANVVIEPLIIERDLGDLTNSVPGDGKVSASIQISGKSKTEWVPPNGESTEQVYERAKKFAQKIKDIPEQKILICAHQNFLRCLELIITGELLSDETFYSANPPQLDYGEIREYSIGD